MIANAMRVSTSVNSGTRNGPAGSSSSFHAGKIDARGDAPASEGLAGTRVRDSGVEDEEVRRRDMVAAEHAGGGWRLSMPSEDVFLTARGGLPRLRRLAARAAPRGIAEGRTLAIDTGVTAFLNSSHFVDWEDPGTGSGNASWPLLALLAVLCGGCSSQPRAQTVEDSLTSGRISVVSATEADPVLSREVEGFQKLYPDARIQTRVSSSRNAIGAVFAAEADLAVITRELETEERAAAVRGGLELEGFRFAGDAIVAIVHPDNPVENLALDDLRALYEGTLTDWSRLGGRAAKVVP